MKLLEFSAGLMIFCQLLLCHTFKTQLCREANASLKYVQRCPRSRMEYRQRSLIKGCSAIPYESCSMGPFEYHCVPDHEGKRLLEVCAPKVLITGHHCSQFNVGIGQVIEDIKMCDVCPFNYNSTEGFKYQSCYEGIHTVITQFPTNRSEEARTSNSFNDTPTIKATFTTPSELHTGKTSKEGPIFLGILYFSVGFICVFAVAIFLIKKCG